MTRRSRHATVAVNVRDDGFKLSCLLLAGAYRTKSCEPNLADITDLARGLYNVGTVIQPTVLITSFFLM